ncbi:hypothetical protein Rhopal_005793-T1 [Rhodotorula paludigena]|uniref:CASTOR ACT domain-containing protein n=1 Tax=Rhodotorula paludigena TaxID=86838 RepID=A0AAV5GS69_9BASI|nr:hypothetical protein Rhopal_005793-T1 [Rhodotorula paludigena]
MAALDLTNPALALSYLPTPLTVFQLRPDQPVPPALLDALIDARGEQSFVSVTRCKDELSVIVPTALFEELYPSSAAEQPHESAGPWAALTIAGPLNLSLTGILHALSGALKDAGVPIFASSTWNTDYVLIEERYREKADEGLREAGWVFSEDE